MATGLRYRLLHLVQLSLALLADVLLHFVLVLPLFGTLMNGMSVMLMDAKDSEAALVTFLVAASGISMLGLGAAFSGLWSGLIVSVAKQSRSFG